jgi:putative lipoic acid-binding regulatory protein|tara:strand:- start:258 stop:530 length:273 start_codon:yes stop_codon:yes gene_type:complete
MQKPEEDSIMSFPCQFPVKAMGVAEKGFDILIVEIIKKHSPDLAEGAIKSRLSQAGKYISITVVVEAESRQQLDDIYLELTAHEKVLMAL